MRSLVTRTRNALRSDAQQAQAEGEHGHPVQGGSQMQTGEEREREKGAIHAVVLTAAAEDGLSQAVCYVEQHSPVTPVRFLSL